MARATVYKGSSSIVPADPVDEIDPLESAIKNEPTSPKMNQLDDTDTPELLCELQAIEANASKQQAPVDSHEPMEIDDAELQADTSVVSSTSKQQGTNDIIDNKQSIRIRKKHRYPDDIVTEETVLDNRLRSRSSLSELIAFKCEICFTSFTKEIALIGHKKYYEHKLLRCHICWKSFKTPMQIMSHRKSAHRNIDWKTNYTKCQMCSLPFRGKSSLQQHIFHFHPNQRQVGVRKRTRTVKNKVIKSESKLPESARTARKRKRDELFENKEIEFDNLPSNSNASIQSCSKSSGKGSAKSSIDNDDRKSLNKDAPFVKIHAIPHEVEALLSDYDDSPIKKRKIETLGETSVQNIRIGRLRSGRMRSANESRGDGESETSTGTDSTVDVSSNAKEKTLPIRKITDNSQLIASGITQNAVRSVTRKWALLKMRYNCRECCVPLKRIERINYNNKYGDLNAADAIDDASGGSIGVQLKNLEIALKKLDVPEDSGASSTHEGGSEASFKGKRDIYRSSVCRTRFTTKQRLINHYLCFHTNLNQDECGVCRMRCGDSKRLKKHLVLHCIKIPKSKQDRSPINPKGPCERYRKKNSCRGCRKRFWLLSCLQKHEEFCRFISRVKTNREVDNDNCRKPTRRLKKVDNNVSTDSFSEINNHANDIVEDEPTDSINTSAKLTEKELNGKLKLVPLRNRSWEVKVSKGERALLCTICNVHFLSKGAFAEHENRYSLRGAARCNQCGTLFPSAKLHLNHLRSAHTEESLNFKEHCTVCYQGFASKRYLRSHILHIHYDQMNRNMNEWTAVNPQYEMKCGECNLIFKNRRHFIEHAMYYFDEEQYSCNICEKKFIGKFRCHAHWKTTHYAKELQKSYTYSCDVCKEGFLYRFHLQSHMLHVHHRNSVTLSDDDHQITTENPYLCTICEESFSTLLLLSQHQNFHSNDGKYGCNKCDRKCRSLSILADHAKLSHPNNPDIKRSQCPICSEAVNSKVSWLSHIKHAHVNPMDLPSEMCLENICTLNQLVNNVNPKKIVVLQAFHVGSTSVTDTVGEVTFNDDDAISMTGEEPLNIEYTCAICDEKFVSMQELKSHKVIHEPTDYGCQNVTNVQEDERSKNNDVIIEPIQLPQLRPYKRLPINNFVNSTVDVQPISFVAPQQISDNTFYSYNSSKDIPCNFSIANICSVELEEYEKIANDQGSLENQSLNTTETTKVIGDNPENDLRCDVCNIVFTCSKTLKNHKIRFSNTGDYICEICGRRFRWMKAYKKHVTKHRKRDTAPLWYCETCDEAFATKNSKAMHFSHIHNEFVAPDDDNCDNSRISTDNARDSSADLNVTSSSQDKSTEKDVYIEEVDLTMDEAHVSDNSQCIKAPTNSVAVKPTIIQPNRLQVNNYRPVDIVTNVCPIYCNICHIQCISIEFLVKHIENAHGMRLSPYKPNSQVDSSTVNSTYEQQNITTQSSYQGNQHLMRDTVYKIDRIESQSSSLDHYCKTCRLHFVNEYSLIAHIRNTHGESGTEIGGDKDDWSSLRGNKISLDKRNTSRSAIELMEKIQIDNATRETSFLNSDKQCLNKDTSRINRAVDLTKQKDRILLTKGDFASDATKGYRIIGGKDLHGNVQIISVQKNDLVNLTRPRLQATSENPESNLQ